MWVARHRLFGFEDSLWPPTWRRSVHDFEFGRAKHVPIWMDRRRPPQGRAFQPNEPWNSSASAALLTLACVARAWPYTHIIDKGTRIVSARPLSDSNRDDRHATAHPRDDRAVRKGYGETGCQERSRGICVWHSRHYRCGCSASSQCPRQGGDADPQASAAVAVAQGRTRCGELRRGRDDSGDTAETTYASPL